MNFGNLEGPEADLSTNEVAKPPRPRATPKSSAQPAADTTANTTTNAE
jgi:hypothetical protein